MTTMAALLGALPLAVYALLASSRFVAVGPVAMVSLLIAASVGELAALGSARYLAFATASRTGRS